MKFVAPEQAPEQAEIIKNTPFWPDVDLSEFRSVMRTDGTVTSPSRTTHPVCDVRGQCGAVRLPQTPAGAGIYDAGRCTGGSAGRQKRAHPPLSQRRVLLGACQVNERYQDYDATASGVKRGDELAEASGDLWRDARWAISRVQDAPHCTVELI